MDVVLPTVSKTSSGDSLGNATTGLDEFARPGEEDDVARVVAENQSNVLAAALGKIDLDQRNQLDAEARKIQSNVRAWILRRQYQQIREATTKVQALAKGHLARKHFQDLREKVSATLVIQKSLRAHIKAKRNRRRESAPSVTSSAPGELLRVPPVPVVEIESGLPQNPSSSNNSTLIMNPATGSGMMLEERRSSTVGHGSNQADDHHQRSVDDVILSFEDPFVDDVNMRDD
jgi:hypothetical protein